MVIGIFSNLSRDINGNAAISLAEFLKQKGIDFVMTNDMKGIDYDCTFVSKEEMAALAEIVVVFGGDGTVLAIAKECAKHGALIFPVNMGHLGFLTEIETWEIEEAVDTVLDNHYIVDERAILEVFHNGDCYLALNEVVVARGARTKLIKVEVFLNEGLVDKYNCDGVIVSTSTGSTAYNLSAGGPILAPNVEAFVITPISSHSLHTRPFVYNMRDEVTIKVKNANTYAYLNIDGEDVCRLHEGCVIKVNQSEYTAKFIRSRTYKFSEKLLDKMNYWSITHKE